MKIDEIDMGILSFLWKSKKGASTVFLTNKIFKPKDKHELIKGNSLIYSRLAKLQNYGLVESTNGLGEKTNYSLKNTCFFKKGSIKICDEETKDELFLDKGEFLVFQHNKKTYTIKI